MLKPEAGLEPGAGGPEPPAMPGVPEEGSGTGELARLHLEVLFRQVLERIWARGGPSLAEIWKLLPADPREISFEQILVVLERIGVPPRGYYFELSRENWRRDVEALCLRHPARPRSAESRRPPGDAPRDVQPIVE